MATFAFILIAYLIGSLSFAVIVSKAFGLPDPHTYGSGNPGATNVLRTGNKLAAVLTLIGDGAKGWLAVFLARAFAWRFGVDDGGIAAAALAVFVGHLWPVFVRFQGGKGVATAAGILLALDWRIGVFTLATWLIIAFFFRYSSLAALAAAVFAPFFTALVLGFGVYAAAVLAIAVLLVWRHAENIRKLVAGTESRIGQKRPRRSARRRQLSEIPPRADGEGVAARRRRRQAQCAGERDHRAVVGAELELRVVNLEAFRGGRCVQPLAQPAVRADAAGDHQPLMTGRLERGAAFRDQHIDDRFLEFRGDVGLRGRLGCGVANERQHRRLQPAEAELEIAARDHRSGQAMAPALPPVGELRERGAAGIAEPEHLRGLVERLAGRVVQRLAEQPVAPDALDLHQLGVTARDEQRDERERRRGLREKRREQVSLQVMHADHRHAEPVSEPGGDARADEQRARKPRPFGVRDRVHLIESRTRVGEHAPHERQRAADVIARGELRHDAAVFGVQRGLRVNFVREQAARAVVQRDACLIAGGFDSQHQHGAASVADFPRRD